MLDSLRGIGIERGSLRGIGIERGSLRGIGIERGSLRGIGIERGSLRGAGIGIERGGIGEERDGGGIGIARPSFIGLRGARPPMNGDGRSPRGGIESGTRTAPGLRRGAVLIGGIGREPDRGGT